MARWGKCDFRQLEKLQNQLQALEKSELDVFFVDASKTLAARLLALVIPATPVGTYPKSSGKKGGTLRRGWGAKNAAGGKSYAQSLPVTKNGSVYTVEIINPVAYASYVEFGHRTVSGGWVEGQYMLTISEEKLKQIAPSVLEKMLLQKLREACNGGN